MSDDVDVLLAGLAPVAPDGGRAALTRIRCRAALRRRARRRTHLASMTGRLARLAGPVVVATLCAFYAAVLMTETMALGR